MAIDITRLDRELHDARLDLTSIRQDGESLTIVGTMDATGTGPLGFPKSRYPFELSVDGVTKVVVEDDERVGVLFIERVTFDEETGVLQLESSIPGRLTITARSPVVHVNRQSQPIAERHWGRWRQV